MPLWLQNSTVMGGHQFVAVSLHFQCNLQMSQNKLERCITLGCHVKLIIMVL